MQNPGPAQIPFDPARVSEWALRTTEHLPGLWSAAANDPGLAVAAFAGTAGAGLTGTMMGSAAYNGAKRALFGMPGDLVVGHRREQVGNAIVRRPVVLPWKDRLLHVQILGPTGSAKTSLMKPWIEQDLRALHKVFVLEIFGDLSRACVQYARALGLPVYYCDALETESLCYNPLAGEDTELVAERIASAIRAFSSHDYYGPMSAVLVRDYVTIARRYAEHIGREADLALLELLVGDRGFYRQVVGARKSEDGALRATAPFLDRRLGSWVNQSLVWSNETTHKNLSNISNCLRELLGTQAARRTLCPKPRDKLLDLDEAINSGVGGVVVLRFPIEAMGSGPARLAAALAFQQFQEVTLIRDPDNAPPLVASLDEFPTLIGREPVAADRSADWISLIRKHNVSVTMAYQGRSRLPDVLLGTLESNGRNLFVSGGLGPSDLLWAQQALGYEDRELKDVRRTTGPYGRSQVSRGKRMEEMPSRSREEIRRLPRGRWLAALVRRGNPQPSMKIAAPKPSSSAVLQRTPAARRARRRREPR